MSDFDYAFEQVLQVEGGWVDNKKDPGGETNLGITFATLQSAIQAGLVPNVTVKDLTKEQAKIIYKALYWDKIKGDQLPYPLNMMVFDAAVNQGVDPAIRMLQKALGIAQDGILGVNTVKAAQAARSGFISVYLANRAMRYMGTRNADVFLSGWLKRLFDMAINSRR